MARKRSPRRTSHDTAPPSRTTPEPARAGAARPGLLLRARRAPTGPAELLALQATLGNRVVQRQLRGRGQSRARGGPLQRDGLNSLGGVALDLAGGDPGRAEIFIPLLRQYGYRIVRWISYDLPQAFTSTALANDVIAFVIGDGGAVREDWLSLAMDLVPAGLFPQARALQKDQQRLLLALKTKVGPISALILAAVGNCATAPERGILFKLLELKLPAETLTPGQLTALAAHWGQLRGDDEAVRRAFQAALKDPATLDAIAPYQFREDQYLAATGYGAATAKTVRDTGTEQLTKQRDQQVEQARAGQRNAAYEMLTKNEKGWVDKKDPPFFSVDVPKWKAAHQKLGDKMKEAAQPQVDQIEQQYAANLANLGQQAQAQGQTAREEYDQYLSDVGFHPQAVPAADATSNDFALARRLVSLLRLGPAGAKLLSTPLKAPTLTRCLDQLGEASLYAILNQLAVADLSLFANADAHLALLDALRSGGVSVAAIKGVGAEISFFAGFCGSAPACTACAQILTVYSVSDLQSLLYVNIGGKGQRMAFLNAARTYCDSAASLHSFLTLLSSLQAKATNLTLWDPATIQNLLTTHGAPGMALPQLRALVGLHTLGRVNKENNFSVWVDLLNLLLKENLVRLVKTADWYPLAGGNTNAIDYEIQAVSNGAFLEEFFAHHHPGATAASVNNPNASKKHLKPVHGNTETQRVYAGAVPKPLADQLQWGV